MDDSGGGCSTRDGPQCQGEGDQSTQRERSMEPKTLEQMFTSISLTTRFAKPKTTVGVVSRLVVFPEWVF